MLAEFRPRNENEPDYSSLVPLAFLVLLVCQFSPDTHIVPKSSAGDFFGEETPDDREDRDCTDTVCGAFRSVLVERCSMWEAIRN